MCGDRCGKEVFGGLRFDWTGEPEAGRGGSAIRHKRQGTGTITDMAAGKWMPGGRDGKYRFVLEAGVQHFRRKPEDHFGESGAGKGAPRQEDRSERQPVASEFAAAWIGARQFHSAARHS